MTHNTPSQADIVVLDFTPQSGHEQAGKRPALVISPSAFNEKTHFIFVCPITNQTKGYPFEVKLTGTQQTTGVVLVDQMKSLDWKARNAIIRDKVDSQCMAQVLHLISLILDF